MNDDIQACFRLFEIQPGASPEAVKQAYRDLVKIWHPDRFPNDPKFQKRANEKTKAINEAYRKILAYQSGNSSYSRARPSEEEGRTRASAEADAARRASEAAEAKAREAAILREQRRRRDEERRQAEERRREQEQARRQAMHTEANQSDDLSGSYAPINWQSAEASKEVFEFLAFAWKSAWIRANNNSFPAAFLGMLMSMNAFSHLKFWSQLLYAVSNSALCWLFSAVPVFLASLGYY